MIVRLVAIGGLLLAGCSGGGGRASKGPPEWFHNPPKGARSLFFVGDATGAPDEGTARELAVQKALSELTVFCGAKIKSDFKSVEAEKNGQYEQMVSMTVDIAGDELTIREATVKKTVVGKNGGAYEAWALVEWPKTQYDAVLAGQKARAQRALELFDEAETATEENKVHLAQEKLSEAQNVLGPMKAQIPIDHATYHNSALLQDGMDALRARLKGIAAERKKVMAVVVACNLDGQKINCPRDEYVGKVKETVSTMGFKVSADTVSTTLAAAILASSSPKTDTTVRSSGYVLAVGYEAELTAREDGVHYVHCSGRGAVFDTDANRILQVKEAPRKKGAHPKKKGAIHFACRNAAKVMVDWLQTELANFK